MTSADEEPTQDSVNAGRDKHFEESVADEWSKAITFYTAVQFNNPLVSTPTPSRQSSIDEQRSMMSRKDTLQNLGSLLFDI